MGEVSIVMATYNGAHYLEEQIESILANTYEDWTMEICDDGSTDRTLSIIERYQELYPNKIKFHPNEEQLGVTRNFLEGAMRANGEYVMFCDQDDVWLPEKIEKTLKFMKEREKLSGENTPIAVFTDAKVVDGALRNINSSFFAYNKLDTKKIDLPHLLVENKMIGCTTMINRGILDKVIEFPNFARYHDWWIALIAAVFGEIAFLNESTMLYRQHSKNMVGSQSFFAYVIDRIKNIKKQKENLIKTEKQAWEFCEIYKKYLLEEQRQIIWDFANIRSENLIERRDRLFRHKLWKTGVARNIGLFFLI
ncbi:MAG: glycosyltransferase family 2 protein [Lachnospiraceae bacterium]|nr:glycosyltransferase family 2 protein [Lachnospiraceae bacterium]